MKAITGKFATLAPTYQAEWAREIERQGRNPYEKFPAATFKTRKV